MNEVIASICTASKPALKFTKIKPFLAAEESTLQRIVSLTMWAFFPAQVLLPPAPGAITSQCPYSKLDYDASTSLLGCYSDSTSDRTLSGREFVLTEINTPQTCSDICGYLGYSYSGVEYST